VKPPSHKVSEPRHQPASHFRKVSATAVSNITEFLQEKSKLDAKRHATALEKLELECRKVEQADMLERKREERAERELNIKQESAKVDMAKQLLSSGDEEVKAAAKKYLLNLFM
jgi:hypothetical protein